MLAILYHLFADDTQLYTILNPNEPLFQSPAFTFKEGAIDKVSDWMTQNKLKLIQSKTEFMILGTKQQVKKVQTSSIRVGGEEIKPKPSVRNLGSHFDVEMKMATHVNHTLKTGYYRHISVIRSISVLKPQRH